MGPERFLQEDRMNKALQWILGLCAVAITLALVFSIVFPLVAPQLGWAGGDVGWTMGRGHMFGGGPMMPGFGVRSAGFGMPFFGLGMLAGPLLFAGLLVLGIVWLVRAVSPSGPAP